MTTKHPLGYVDGIGAGIAALALLVALLLAMASPHFAEMYKSTMGIRLSGTTALVLSTAWRVVVPTALIAAFVGAHVWRPRYVLIRKPRCPAFPRGSNRWRAS